MTLTEVKNSEKKASCSRTWKRKARWIPQSTPTIFSTLMDEENTVLSKTSAATEAVSMHSRFRVKRAGTRVRTITNIVLKMDLIQLLTNIGGIEERVQVGLAGSERAPCRIWHSRNAFLTADFRSTLEELKQRG